MGDARGWGGGFKARYRGAACDGLPLYRLAGMHEIKVFTLNTKADLRLHMTSRYLCGAARQSETNCICLYCAADDELEDAQWFDIEEVRCALSKKHRSTSIVQTNLQVPPRVAIAHQLMRSWALDGELK